MGPTFEDLTWLQKAKKDGAGVYHYAKCKLSQLGGFLASEEESRGMTWQKQGAGSRKLATTDVLNAVHMMEQVNGTLLGPFLREQLGAQVNPREFPYKVTSIFQQYLHSNCSSSAMPSAKMHVMGEPHIFNSALIWSRTSFTGHRWS